MTASPLRPGATYLERGYPVTILTRWGPGGGPRNVLIQRADGTRVVRPFRGLRRPPPPAQIRWGNDDECYQWAPLGTWPERSIIERSTSGVRGD